MQMTPQQVQQREHDKTGYSKLRTIEGKLAAIAADSPKRHTLESLMAAYDLKTGGDLMAEITGIHAGVPKLQRRYSQANAMAYTLVGQSLNGQDWQF